MRYIGALAALVADKELQHLKTLLEREALMRSVKHLFNEQLRDAPETHVSAVLAHLLNILLAPFPLLERLDDGSITYPFSAAATVVANGEEVETIAKEEKVTKSKKQKKNKKKEESQKQSAAPADLGEMLLKNGGSNPDVQPFAVEGLFVDTSIFKGLLPIDEPAILRVTPSEFYEKIRTVSKQRYGLELPAKITELRSL